MPSHGTAHEPADAASGAGAPGPNLSSSWGRLPRFVGWSTLLYEVELTGLTSELGVF